MIKQEVVWFINDYAGSPFHGMTFRHYYMAKELKKNGVKPIIITGAYSHFLQNLPSIGNRQYLYEKVDMIDYLWLKVIRYRDSKDKKRVLKWFQFCMKLTNLPDFLDNPDVIVCSTSAPMMVIPSYYLAKKYNAKLVFEIRDLWPLTLMELGNYSDKNPLIYIMQKSILFGFKRADRIVSVLPYTNLYIKEQGIDNFNFTYIPNGISLEELKKRVFLNQDVVNQIPKNKFIIGYAGAMGVGDRMDILIDSAIKLREYSNIHFVLVGKGSEKPRLKERIIKEKINNVTIIDAIPKNEVQSLLKLFDVCFIGWEDKKIYRYGISANKIFDYMYSSKPILHLYSGNGDLIEIAKCGISIKEHNSTVLSKAILKLYNTPKIVLNQMGRRGKEYVLKNHTYENITQKFIRTYRGIDQYEDIKYTKETFCC